MLLTSLLGGQELASQLLNKGCRGDSEALLCWTHPKSWPRVDLGGQDRRRGGKLQGGPEASCCAPTCRQLLLLQQDGVGHAQLGQVVQGLATKTASTWKLQWRPEDSGEMSFYLWRPHRPQMEPPCRDSPPSSSKLDYLSACASVAKLLDNKT